MMTEQTQEQQIEDGERAIRAAYWTCLRSMAQDAKDEIKAGTISDQDELTEWIEQSVDGSQYIIYTRYNLHVLMATDHDDAYEEMGLDGLDSGSSVYQRIAFCGMVEDLREELSDVDFDDDSDDE